MAGRTDVDDDAATRKVWGSIVLIAPGNTFRGDDGVGPIIAARIRSLLGGDHMVPLIDGAVDALSMIDAWEQAGLAVVVDAAVDAGPTGTVRRLDLTRSEMLQQVVSKDLARCSSHGLGLAEALKLGGALDRLPAHLLIYTVAAGSLALGSALSPEVAHAAEEIARRVAAEIASFGRT